MVYFVKKCVGELQRMLNGKGKRRERVVNRGTQWECRLGGKSEGQRQESEFNRDGKKKIPTRI